MNENEVILRFKSTTKYGVLKLDIIVIYLLAANLIMRNITSHLSVAQIVYSSRLRDAYMRQ